VPCWPLSWTASDLTVVADITPHPRSRLPAGTSGRQPEKAIRAALEQTGLEARYLELEITESAVMHDPDAMVGTLGYLKETGVLISIDDFGTGYSSLGQLKRFPFDKLEIDQSFVRDITTDPDDAAIALTTIAMAHSLKLEVIAEGKR